MRLPDLLIVLGTLGAIPRLLTLLHLWQLKEWRFDRLNEHLKREGHLHQLWGSQEPMLIGGLMLIHVFFATHIVWTMGLLSILILAQGAKMVLRGQILPDWTQKAMLTAVVSTVIITAFAWWLSRSPALYVGLFALPLTVPFTLLISWILLKPIDLFLKTMIIRKATKLRSRYADLIVIGITGSAGKTTTKELLGHILGDLHPFVSPKHVNTEMGVAKWMLQTLSQPEFANRGTGNETRIMVVEMGAYRKGEIGLLCRIAQPTMGIVTIVGEQHLALFGSKEAIVKAKGELFASLPEDGTAFANADDPVSASMLRRAKAHHVTVGTGKGADLVAEDITETSKGIRFRVDATTFDVPVHGTHNVTNTLLAIAVARKLGMADAKIAERLKHFAPPARTFSVRMERGVKILDDTYNASPGSFRAAIAWARNQPHNEKTLLFSGIIELGKKDEQRIHKELGEEAQDLFDNVYMLNNNCVRSFSQGLHQKVNLLSDTIAPVPKDSLLVCIGRLPPSLITKFLP